MTTTTGVLFMKAEATITTAKIPIMARFGLFSAADCAAVVNVAKAPVRTKAPITRNIAAMVHGAGFDRTVSASL